MPSGAGSQVPYWQGHAKDQTWAREKGKVVSQKAACKGLGKMQGRSIEQDWRWWNLEHVEGTDKVQWDL